MCIRDRCWHNSELSEEHCKECTPGYLFNDSPISPLFPTAPVGAVAAMKNIGDAAAVAAGVNVA